MTRKFGALSSSVNPEQLSTTVSGAILSVSALLIWGANLLDVPLTQNQIAAFATQAGLALGGLAFIYGVVRKLVVTVNAKYFVKE
jgi:hypothetical protein